jgi:hypothetical protein
MRIGCWFGFLTVVLGSTLTARGQMVVDAGHGFTFQTPTGFTRLDRLPTPDTLYAFATSDPAAGLPEAAVMIQSLPGRITGGVGHVPLPDNAPPGARMTVRKWGSTDIDVMEANTYVAGVPVAVRVAQIPLPGKAIQIDLMTRTTRRTPIDVTLDQALAGLAVVGSDPTSGITPADGSEGESAERQGERLGEGLVVVAVAGVGLVMFVMNRLTRDR